MPVLVLIVLLDLQFLFNWLLVGKLNETLLHVQLFCCAPAGSGTVVHILLITMLLDGKKRERENQRGKVAIVLLVGQGRSLLGIYLIGGASSCTGWLSLSFDQHLLPRWMPLLLLLILLWKHQFTKCKIRNRSRAEQRVWTMNLPGMGIDVGYHCWPLMVGWLAGCLNWAWSVGGDGVGRDTTEIGLIISTLCCCASVTARLLVLRCVYTVIGYSCGSATFPSLFVRIASLPVSQANTKRRQQHLPD